MPKLVWLETFEIGVPEIDDDHKQILSVMRNVRSAAEREQTDLCGKYLDELLVVSRAHFQREEDFLRKWEYGDLEGHIRYHQALYSRADAMKKTCQDALPGKDLETCCGEMMDFLIDDVIRGDLPLKSFFQEKGLAKPQ